MATRVFLLDDHEIVRMGGRGLLNMGERARLFRSEMDLSAGQADGSRLRWEIHLST